MSKLVAVLLLTNSLAAIWVPLRVTVILLKSRLSISPAAKSSVKRTSKAVVAPELENVTSKAIVSSASLKVGIEGVAVFSTLMISGSNTSTATWLEVWESALSAVATKPSLTKVVLPVAGSSIVPSWVVTRFSTTALNSTTAYSWLLLANVSSSLLRTVPRSKRSMVSSPSGVTLGVIELVRLTESILLWLPCKLPIVPSLELIKLGSSATKPTSAVLSSRYLSPAGKTSLSWRLSISPSGNWTNRR